MVLAIKSGGREFQEDCRESREVEMCANSLIKDCLTLNWGNAQLLFMTGLCSTFREGCQELDVAN